MSVNHPRRKEKSIMGKWVLLIGIIIFLTIWLSLIVNPFWWLLLPLTIIIVVVIKLMSNYFWLEEKSCPRCNAPVGKYSEYCRNCGLKLWFRCISCGKYMWADTKFCNDCNIELKHDSVERDTAKYEILEKGSPSPEIPNHCYNCGASLKNPGIIKYCEECGVKIK